MAQFAIMDTSITPLAKAMKDKMTDQQLADAVGVDRSLITRLRNGQRRMSLDRAVKIAKQLDVSLEALIEAA